MASAPAIGAGRDTDDRGIVTNEKYYGQPHRRWLFLVYK